MPLWRKQGRVCALASPLLSHIQIQRHHPAAEAPDEPADDDPDRGGHLGGRHGNRAAAAALLHHAGTGNNASFLSDLSELMYGLKRVRINIRSAGILSSDILYVDRAPPKTDLAAKLFFLFLLSYFRRYVIRYFIAPLYEVPALRLLGTAFSCFL